MLQRRASSLLSSAVARWTRRWWAGLSSAAAPPARAAAARPALDADDRAGELMLLLLPVGRGLLAQGYSLIELRRFKKILLLTHK